MDAITRTVGLSGNFSAKHRKCAKAPLSWRVRNFTKHRAPDMPRLVIASIASFLGVPVLTSKLYAKHRRVNPLTGVAEWTDYGLISTRVVTTAGVNFIVDAFQNTTEVENLRFHGVGTGTTAEAVGDTALVAESTTILNPDSTRPTGSLAEGATANIFRSVGTVSFDGSGAITEHGIFSQAATGGGTLLDRSVFSAINVVSGDSIQFTYELTFTAGS